MFLGWKMVKQQFKQYKYWPMIALVAIAICQPVFAVSAEEAAAIVSAKVTGRVLDVKGSNEQGRALFLIKVLTEDSRVIIVRVDAKTGQVLP